MESPVIPTLGGPDIETAYAFLRKVKTSAELWRRTVPRSNNKEIIGLNHLDTEFTRLLGAKGVNLDAVRISPRRVDYPRESDAVANSGIQGCEFLWVLKSETNSLGLS